MPTTKDEASKILEISGKYLTPSDARELFTRLEEEVGKHTDNESLKQSLIMMRQLVQYVPETETVERPSWWMWVLLYTVIIFHMAVVFGLVGAFFVLPIKWPWEIALPLMTFIQFFALTKVECKITALENHIRKRMGLRRIGTFIGHYFFKPYKKWRGRRLEIS